MPGLYLHIPLCRRKCGYCDFYSENSPAAASGLVASLLSEMRSRRDYLADGSLQTIYVGGGTPSLLPAAALGSLLDEAHRLWDCGELTETTAEVNPDDITPDYLDGLLAAGFNRLSIGIQSFDDRRLSFLGRRHDAASAVRAVQAAQKAGFGNISIDLIYGIPGMDDAEWQANLDSALGLGVQHISAYCLTVEEDTPFGRMRRRGELTETPEEDVERQYLMLHESLSAAGFRHYEISNFALPGLEARHNGSYWRGVPYLGLGPSAHSFDGHERRWCVSSLNDYIKGDFRYEHESLTPRDRYNEFIMTSLRTAEGIDTEELTRRFGSERHKALLGIASDPALAPLIVRENGRIRIPPEKFLLSDSVSRTLFETD